LARASKAVLPFKFWFFKPENKINNYKTALLAVFVNIHKPLEVAFCRNEP
jgi:hypothetical protein